MTPLVSHREAHLQARQVVVKLGSQVVLDAQGRPALARLYSHLESLAALHRKGHQFVLITSGAIGLGGQHLQLAPTSTAERRACSAVGQGELISLYLESLQRLGLKGAQVLITGDDLAQPARSANLRATLQALLERGVLPILNENDAMPSALEAFPDNDHLAAQVAVLMGADLLVLLSDVEGLHTQNPRLHPEARPIAEVAFDACPQAECQGHSASGRGGMASKVAAAQQAAAAGIPVVLASGHTPQVLEALLSGESHGTLFQPAPRSRSHEHRRHSGPGPRGAKGLPPAGQLLHRGAR